MAHLKCESSLSYMRPIAVITAKAAEHVLKNNYNNYDSNTHCDSPELLILWHPLWIVPFIICDNWDKYSTALVSRTRGFRKVRYCSVNQDVRNDRNDDKV